MSNHFDIIVVGGGPAGLTAAIYARRAGRSVLLLEKEGFGGQIASSPKVENFPGFDAISGAELVDRLYNQADALGARIELEEVLSVETGAPHTVTTEEIESKCAWSPFEGHTFRWGITHTWVNGHAVYADGKFDESIMGERMEFC